MKKRILMSLLAILCIATLVNFASAQDTKMKDDEMKDMAMKTEMHKSSHHKMNMAFQQNIVNLAKTLSEMAKDEKTFDKVIARIATEEMEHSLEKMDEIHSRHLATFSKEMLEKMESKMEKKSKNETALNESICELSMILQSKSLNLKAFETHANAIVAYFNKKEKRSTTEEK